MDKIYQRCLGDRKPKELEVSPNSSRLGVLEHNSRCLAEGGCTIYWRRNGQGFDAFWKGVHVYASWIAKGE